MKEETQALLDELDNQLGDFLEAFDYLEGSNPNFLYAISLLESARFELTIAGRK